MVEKKQTSASLDLEFPVEVDGIRYDKLTIRRMKVGDLFAAEEETNEARAGFILFARLAGVPLAVIMELDYSDVERLTEVAAPMMGKSAQSAKSVEAAKLKAKGSTPES